MVYNNYIIIHFTNEIKYRSIMQSYKSLSLYRNNIYDINKDINLYPVDLFFNIFTYKVD